MFFLTKKDFLEAVEAAVSKRIQEVIQQRCAFEQSIREHAMSAARGETRAALREYTKTLPTAAEEVARAVQSEVSKEEWLQSVIDRIKAKQL